MNGNGGGHVRPQGRRGAIRPGPPGGRGGPGAPAPGGRGRGRGMVEQPEMEKPKEDTKKSPSGTPPKKKSPRDSSEERLQDELNRLSLQKVKLVPRPGQGTIGRKFPIKANHFSLNFTAKDIIVVQQYNVEVIHDRRKLYKEERHQVFWTAVHRNEESLFETRYNLAYDGDHICFTTKKINFGGGKHEWEFKVEQLDLERDDRPQDCTVRFRHVGQVALDLSAVRDRLAMGETQTPIQVIDVIFRQARTCTIMDTMFHPAGRSFYLPPEPRSKTQKDLGDGREIWQGFFASAHVASNWKPLMNVDVSNTAYYKEQECLRFMCDVMKKHDQRNKTNKFVPQNFHEGYFLTPEEKRTFERELRDLRVVVKHGRSEKVYKVNGLTPDGASQITFTQRMRDGTERQTTVADYFAETYGQRLQFPNLPCVHVGSKRKNVYMPLEKCHVRLGQKVQKKLVDTQLAKMIREVCTDAPTREQTINNLVQKAQLGADPFVKNFELSFEPRMVQFQARQLPPPELLYGNNRTVRPTGGEWRTQGMQFYASAKVDHYWLFSFMHQKYQQALERFCESLSRVASGLGMSMPPYPIEVSYITSQDKLRESFDYLDGLDKAKRPDFILVVIQAKGNPMYSVVKRLAEIRKGVMTQCCIFKTVTEAKPTTQANLILKLNAKLGGINNSIRPEGPFKYYFVDEPTLVLGVDVTHPGPTDTRQPSVASMVGNLDIPPNKFAASIKVQKHRREALVYLGDLVKERLMAFYKNTKFKPTRIIVYRDGVSEGQFKQVMLEEMRGIRTACSSLDETYFPKITFIVVQKRHHTRFFCANKQDMSGRAMNVPPGTVVDTDVVHPVNFDFYLVSHQGLLGTSRPTHYQVLHDDSNFSADEIEAVSYQLSHIYCRCTKSVSIPAPVYYADLACQRARHHLLEKLNEMSSDSGSRAGDRRGQPPPTAPTGSGTGDGVHSNSTEDRELRAAVQIKTDSDLPLSMYFV